MIRRLLKQIREFHKEYGKYPAYIYITKKQYNRLKKELSIVEEITDNIKILYSIEYRERKEEDGH